MPQGVYLCEKKSDLLIRKRDYQQLTLNFLNNY